MSGWLLPLHAGLGPGHQWLDQLAAIVLIGGLWLLVVALAERRMGGASNRSPASGDLYGDGTCTICTDDIVAGSTAPDVGPLLA